MCKVENKLLQKSVSRFIGGEDKLSEGRIEGGEQVLYTRVSKGEDLTVLCIRSVSLFVTVCVSVNTESITTNPRAETRNLGHFTRMYQEIYGCVSVCMCICRGMSVFSEEMLCMTQDRLVFVRAGVRGLRALLQTVVLKKWKRDIL